MKVKKDLIISNNPNVESHKKVVLKRGEVWFKPVDFTWNYLCHFVQKETTLTLSSFFAGTSLSLLLDTRNTSESRFIDIAFFNIETKLK